MKKRWGIIGEFGIAATCLVLCAISPKAAGDVAINSDNFPDAAFREVVSNSCDKDKNGILSEAEIKATTSLSVGDRLYDDESTDDEITEGLKQKFKSLKGIENFTELTDLWIGYVDSFDQRIQVGIKDVDLSKNTKLKKLTLVANVTKLDLSENKDITELEISSCNIKTVDITCLKKLEKVSFVDCYRLTDIAMYSVKNIKGTGYRMGHDDSDLPGTFYRCGRLNTITFEGNAPKFEDDSFGFPILVATVYYPQGNKTWKKVINKDYGGIITWKSYDPDGGRISNNQESTTLPKLPTGAKVGNDSTEGLYKVNKDGVTLQFIEPITDEGKDAEEISIASTIRIGGYDYPVTSIGKNAFKGYENLTSIHLGEKIKKVDKNAFKGFTKNKVTVYIYTKSKKVYNKIKSVIKAKAPKNVKYKKQIPVSSGL